MLLKLPNALNGLLASALMVLSNVALSGVIRDDVADADYLARANLPQFSGVGDMIINGSTRCSGSVIDDTWVLTAAHCVDGSISGITFNVGGNVYAGVDWIVHGGWTGSVADGNDIALVELATDVTGVSFADLYTGASEVGATGTNVGFGRTGTGLTGQTLPSGTFRAGDNVIDSAFINLGNGAFEALIQDFDNPNNPGDSTFGSSTPLPLEYLIGSGDSGGGLFIEEGGQWYVAGVHSFGASTDGNTDSDYGDISGSTRVSSFVGWILDNITPTATNVPVPSVFLLMLAGLGLLRLNKNR